MKHLSASVAALAAVCLFSLAGCSDESDTLEHIAPTNTNGYYFDVFTQAAKSAPRDGVIELENSDDDLYFQIENTGQARQLAVQIFVDCEQVSFLVEGVKYEAFPVDAGETFSETYRFNLAEPLDTGCNHSLLAVLVAGADQFTSQVDFDPTDQYSIALNHLLSFGENLPMASSGYGEAETSVVTDYQSSGLLLNADVENRSRAIPAAAMTVGAGEEFALQYQVGGYDDCEEVAVLITIGLKQAAVNGQEYLLCRVDDGALVSGVARLTAPDAPGEYEVMGWAVKSPFEAGRGEYLPLDAAYRFTLVVE